ncbi:MAG: ATP synthase F1 subunit epsilon [Bacteroidota bacterium]|nr:ATP synthase F1 subunit epsilon [Bacteroidota bacterium]
MYLEIISPENVLFEGEVRSVKLPGEEGYFEILDNHAPIIALLKEGEIRIIKDDGEKEFYDTDSGFVEVVKNKVIVLI